jgi:ABC-type transport system substrate-binding protein
LLVAMVVIAGACGSSSPSGSSSDTAQPDDGGVVDEGPPVDGGSLVIGIGAETNGWNTADDQIATDGSFVVSSVLEPLASIGPDHGAKPWLADSWYPNETFTSWVLELHPGITFHDGQPFDAQAVVDNIDAYRTGSITGLVLQPMLAGAEVLDPLKVQVDLLQPWAAFPSSFLAGGTSYMMAPSMIEAGADGEKHPVGTGPFVFDSWSSGSSFKTSRNEHYWKAGLPHLDSLEFRVIPDDSARAAALQSGDVNMAVTSTAGPANDLRGSYTVVEDWTTDNVFIQTNTSATVDDQPNPLANLHARRALAYATDRQAVAAVVGDGVTSPTSPWAPTNPWGQPDDQNGYVDLDLDQARAEVAAYKEETGASSLSFVISGLPDVDGSRVLQLLQSQWAEAGIETKIETLEQAAYITKIALGNFQAAFLRNYGYADPDQNFHFWSSSTAKGVGNISVNFSQYSTPEIDQDLATGRQSGFADVRKQAYDDLARQLNAGLTNIWLYRTPYSLIADRQVRGLNGPRQVPFGSAQPKTWIGELWRADG